MIVDQKERVVALVQEITESGDRHAVLRDRAREERLKGEKLFEDMHDVVRQQIEALLVGTPYVIVDFRLAHKKSTLAGEG